MCKRIFFHFVSWKKANTVIFNAIKMDLTLTNWNWMSQRVSIVFCCSESLRLSCMVKFTEIASRQLCSWKILERSCISSIRCIVNRVEEYSIVGNYIEWDSHPNWTKHAKFARCYLCSIIQDARCATYFQHFLTFLSNLLFQLIGNNINRTAAAVQRGERLQERIAEKKIPSMDCI